MVRLALSLTLILAAANLAPPPAAANPAAEAAVEPVLVNETVAAPEPTLATGSVTAVPAAGPVCLGREARRAAAETHKFVPLTRAMRSARKRVAGDVVKARLCRSGEAFVYLLTVLARDGKVTQVSVNAATGRLVEAR